MKTKYHTKKGSVYTRQVTDGKEIWYKEDANGVCRSLEGGVHITIKSLHKLYVKTPSLADRTYCFDMGGKEELFDKARKEQCVKVDENEDTLIFFLLKNETGDYGVGCSSLIQRIEVED